jgi:hypothetical protein
MSLMAKREERAASNQPVRAGLCGEMEAMFSVVQK